MPHDPAGTGTAVSLLEELRGEFGRLKVQAERALAQVDDEAFFAAIDPDSNSLAVLVKHVANNLKSRWTDFLDTDGEKPDRDRDGEFVIGPEDTRESLMARWALGWERLTGALAALGEADLSRTVFIRSEPHSVIRAALRSLTHTAGHVGQIVLLARHACGSRWETLSVPRGESAQFTARIRARFGSPDPQA
ncbi:MAG TPA: DUF1572 family protein [Vicinamibacterales bacterium]